VPDVFYSHYSWLSVTFRVTLVFYYHSVDVSVHFMTCISFEVTKYRRLTGTFLRLAGWLQPVLPPLSSILRLCIREIPAAWRNAPARGYCGVAGVGGERLCQ
jgi:hypothetical protein